MSSWSRGSPSSQFVATPNRVSLLSGVSYFTTEKATDGFFCESLQLEMENIRGKNGDDMSSNLTKEKEQLGY